MVQFYRLLFLFFLILGVSFNVKPQQGLKINEIMSSNTFVVYDEDGDTPDWFEIINTGNSAIKLSDYFVSEGKKNLMKWQLPDYHLQPNNILLVYASGKDRLQTPLHWYTIIDVGQPWKYFLPKSEPTATWKSYSFAETGWLTGPTGIGFGDNDDNTVIPTGTISVFMRKKFTVTNLSELKSLWFHMDYDDGFVAYINGTEICRAGLGATGSAVPYNMSASSHEAKMYSGGSPDGFNISDFITLLKENENVLAIQVHNAGAGSSDLTAIPFLTAGYENQVAITAPVSKYFQMPVLYPHTNFKLSSAGETLSITHKDGTIADSISYGIIPSNYSMGRDTSILANWGYFATPTPGSKNTTPIASDIVRSVIKFSISEMFLKTPTQLTFSGAANGEKIRYTLNSSEPNENSKLYSGPITLAKNTVVRARVFKPGAIPGKITTRTYLFDAPPTLPVISVSTDSLNLWDNNNGIYVLGPTYENQNPYFGANFWEDWEKPASIEMTGTDGERVFSLNCGIKIFGAWSRAHPQKSLAVFFRNEYGEPVLEDVQLFHSKPITTFKSLVLRNSGNDYGYTRFRDGMMTDLVKDLDTDIAAFEPVILYLNGQYWGHINMREKINEDYLESNYNVDADKVDLLEYESTVLEGSNADYLEMLDFLKSNSLTNDANYQFIASQIDVDNFIDYQLSQIYFNNRDWPGNNIKFWKPQTDDGLWRWIMFDTDFGFGIYNSNDFTLNTIQFALEPNGPSWPNPPWSTFLLRKLVENKKFQNRFINRFADMLNTTFVGSSVVSKIDSMAAIIQPEIQRHNSRWGTPSQGGWQNAVQTMRNFALNRVPYVQNHINQQFVKAGIFEVTISNFPVAAGSIKLNTIEIAGEAWKGKYFENVPVSLTAKAVRGYRFKQWEVNGVAALDQTIEVNLKKATTIKAAYEVTVDDGNSVVINEINYNSPVENDAGDWVEIYNWGRVDLDISGWILKDDDDSHQFVIPENTILKSKEFLVICRNTNNFKAIHPNVAHYLGNMDFGLASVGDEVRLFTNAGVLVDSVSFKSELPWPVEPNGNGPTLELRHYSHNGAVAESWKAALENLGTPGRENSVTTGSDLLVINYSEKQLQIYPNPFTSETRIKIENNGLAPIKIQIYSMDGRLVRSEIILKNEYVWRGDNQAGQQLQPGIYICKVQSDNQIFTGKIIMGK
ncbi:MAG: CotH kinase family protein [Draconibacterium sp.]|nr:CotH kinase family protein [Draconibacterium sp.]